MVEATPTFNIFSNLISDREIQHNFNDEVFFQYVLVWQKLLAFYPPNPRMNE